MKPLPMPILATLDPVDAVIAAGIIRGHNYKKIAKDAGLTYKAIDHRIVRLRNKHKSKNACHLVAVLLNENARMIIGAMLLERELEKMCY